MFSLPIIAHGYAVVSVRSNYKVAPGLDRPAVRNFARETRARLKARIVTHSFFSGSDFPRHTHTTRSTLLLGQLRNAELCFQGKHVMNETQPWASAAKKIFGTRNPDIPGLVHITPLIERRTTQHRFTINERRARATMKNISFLFSGRYARSRESPSDTKQSSPPKEQLSLCFILL